MTNLWILTEERPKASVVKTILEEYCREYSSTIDFVDSIKITPIFVNNKFTFDYEVANAVVSGIKSITIKIVNGNSSFIDYLLCRQDNAPDNHSLDNVLMAIEETKTSDAESRNTGIYQRASKFAYIDNYCPSIKKYMLYNEEATSMEDRTPTTTNVFGTNMLLTLGVKFLGKPMQYFKAFDNLEEMIALKAQMPLPNSTNIPILLKQSDNAIYVSGRLAKPADAGNIGHDPNIGALSCISATLRKLGWTKDIIITRHGVSQSYVNKNARGNKFLFLSKLIGMKLDGISMPIDYIMPDHYWKYSNSTEKVASILFHMISELADQHAVYENHAGCERGYFRANAKLFALPKKDRNGINLYIPDVIINNDAEHEMLLIEGKVLRNLQEGLSDLENYDSIETEFIKPYFPSHKIKRWVTIFGGSEIKIPHEKVILYLSNDGTVIINDSAPTYLKQVLIELMKPKN